MLAFRISRYLPMEIHNYCEKNYNIDCKSFRKNKKKNI